MQRAPETPQLFWYLDLSRCLLTLLLLMVRESQGTRLSQPVSRRKQHGRAEGILPLLTLTRKHTRKFFIGKNLEENTGEWAETFLLTDWREAQPPLCSPSARSQPVTLERFGSLAPASSGTWRTAGARASCSRGSGNPWNELPSRGTFLSLR